MASAVSRFSRSITDSLSSLGHRAVTGLSVEGHDLRMLCVSGQEIVRFASRPLDPNLMPGGMVADPAGFGNAVREAMLEYDFPHGRVVAGFPDLDARSRLLPLPSDSRNKIGDVVKREARHDPVMGKDDYRLFHQIVEEGQSQITVFILAVRRQALSNFIQGLKMANLAPQIVDLRPLALIRAVNQPHSIAVNIERGAMDVVIVRNNMPVIMRSVPLNEDQPSIVDDVIRELEVTIAAYNNEYPTPLNPRLPLALTGDLASGLEMQQAVQERLGHPLAALSCPFTGAPGLDVANYMVNIGLVLKAR